MPGAVDEEERTKELTIAAFHYPKEFAPFCALDCYEAVVPPFPVRSPPRRVCLVFQRGSFYVLFPVLSLFRALILLPPVQNHLREPEWMPYVDAVHPPSHTIILDVWVVGCRWIKGIVEIIGRQVGIRWGIYDGQKEGCDRGGQRR